MDKGDRRIKEGNYRRTHIHGAKTHLKYPTGTSFQPKQTVGGVGGGANSISQRDSLTHIQIQVEPDRQGHG